MVYCVAPNCQNDSRKRTPNDGVNYFSFPRKASDFSRYRKWVNACRRLESWRPTASSVLCSDHFSRDAFERDPGLCRSLGLNIKLKSDAVPSLFNYSKDGTTTHHKVPKFERSAVRKRKCLEVLSHNSKSTDTLDAINEDVSDDCKEDEENMQPCIMDVGVQTPLLLIQSRSTQAQITAKTTHEGTNTYLILHEDKSVQTDMICCLKESATQTETGKIDHEYEDIEIDNGSDCADDDDHSERDGDDDDDDWVPTDSEKMDYLEDDYEQLDSSITSWSAEHFTDYARPDNVREERKFIVFESSLRLLFSICHFCLLPCKSAVRVFGSAVFISTLCEAGHKWSWNSQPMHGQLPLGNLLIAAGILFSGSSPAKALNSLLHIGVSTISLRTYNTVQSLYLVPAVLKRWKLHQTELLHCCNAPVKLSGDARCCSPGHTAKYGSYSLMDSDTSKVLDLQLVQSNEVKNSTWMELEGLKRGLSFLQTKVNITHLITDRHVQIKKYLREHWPMIIHWFDCWHVAKGIYKQLMNQSKKNKLCKILSLWSHSISNHIYWCAASSGGREEEVREKWLSILNHVCNIHKGHGDLFPNCLHGQLDDRQWIRQGSKAHEELKLILTRSTLVKDIGKLSPCQQTSALESFHKVCCFFAPKSFHYHYEPMKCRLLLAALHFNENSNIPQKKTKDGKPMWSISYPKGRMGEGVAKEIKVEMSYQYVCKLIDEVLSLRREMPSYRLAGLQRDAEERYVPPPVCSKFQKGEMKESIIHAHASRFNKK